MAIDILVVEDEYTERQELTQLLETVTPPEHIRSAATCSAAIAAISQLCPDLILLDIMLRGSSGFEVAEFVRSNRLDCKIIILTAYHEFDFASKALSMDLQDYLLKPVRPSVLLQRVRDVLHLSSPARAATGLAVWPYLACGISSPLPPIPNLLPNMTVVGILRDGTDREVISQINLSLHGTGWTEQDGRRVIGYCRTAPQQSPEEAAEPLVAAWRQRLEGLAAVGIGGPSEQGLAESYRSACRAADCRIFHPEGTLVCRDTASDVPEPYPLKAEGQLLHALRSEEGGLEEGLPPHGALHDSGLQRRRRSPAGAADAAVGRNRKAVRRVGPSTAGAADHGGDFHGGAAVPEDTDRLRGCALPAGSGAGFGASSGAGGTDGHPAAVPGAAEAGDCGKGAVRQCGVSGAYFPGADGPELPGCSDGGADAAGRAPSAPAGLRIGHGGGCGVQRLQLLQPCV